MPRFTKKPVTIDAMLAGEILDLRGVEAADAFNAAPEWFRVAFVTGVVIIENIDGRDVVLINTQGHGQVRAERTDWIIRGVQGELYPCRPDVFEATYTEGEFALPSAVITIKGDMPPEQFAAFKRQWSGGSTFSPVMHDSVDHLDQLELAWGLIANAGGGDWKTQEWQDAAVRWRESYHGIIDASVPMGRVETRDELQKRVTAWAVECFGEEEATSLPQRALRLLEESVELFQACGNSVEMARKLVDYVFDRPPGDVAQEIGGVSVTLLVLCAAAGMSADVEERREIVRVVSKSASHFSDRNAAKNTVGFKVTHVGLTAHGLELGTSRPAPTPWPGSNPNKIVDQPPPVARLDLVPAWLAVISDMEQRFGDTVDKEMLYRSQEVISDMRERDRIGRERYGTPLTANNGRDQVVDAYQEQLDTSVYMRAAIMEGIPISQIVYGHVLDGILWMRTFMHEREVRKV